MRRLILAVLLVAGCEPVPTTGSLFAPDLSAGSVATETTGTDEAFELDSYKKEQSEADTGAKEGDVEGAALFEELGAGGREAFHKATETAEAASVEQPAATVAPQGMQPMMQPMVMQPMMMQPPAPTWTPANAVTLSWGLRLVTTVNEATPPRAILGLPDGSEEVVKAGDMLPDVGVVVLAVGHGVIQVGQITREGDHVRVESVFLQSMYPGVGGH